MRFLLVDRLLRLEEGKEIVVHKNLSNSLTALACARMRAFYETLTTDMERLAMTQRLPAGGRSGEAESV